MCLLLYIIDKNKINKSSPIHSSLLLEHLLSLSLSPPSSHLPTEVKAKCCSVKLLLSLFSPPTARSLFVPSPVLFPAWAKGILVLLEATGTSEVVISTSTSIICFVHLKLFKLNWKKRVGLTNLSFFFFFLWKPLVTISLVVKLLLNLFISRIRNWKSMSSFFCFVPLYRKELNYANPHPLFPRLRALKKKLGEQRQHLDELDKHM